jgi:hypothetical protein
MCRSCGQRCHAVPVRQISFRFGHIVDGRRVVRELPFSCCGLEKVAGVVQKKLGKLEKLIGK